MPPHRQFGDYELIAEIGRGGMGLVYRARQTRLNRLVALKLVRDAHLDSPGAGQRFQVEAEAAAKLHHPNIVPIHEFGREGEQRYLSMQLIEGENLVQHMHGVPLDSRKLAGLMATLAHAVHHAHQHGVIHRDLKPANVLIDAQGQPHITDFGCARFTDRSSVLTLPNDVLGSPNYMAPEQAVGGSEQVTTAVDIYSLGAIMYELLSGRPPFRAGTPLETLRKVMEEDPVSPRHLYRFADADLEAICLKCMEKHPRGRYSSAEALAEDLERWLRGEPIQARPVTTVERVRKWARRRPRVAALVVLLQVVGLLGLAGILWMGARAAAHARESHQRMLQMHVATGNRLVEENDQFEGLLWLTEALRQEDGGAVREENHRYRIDAVLRQSPRLEQILFHGDWILGVAFSPDGTRLMTGGSDRTARVWDLRTGEAVVPPLPHSGSVETGQFSSDGKRLLTMDRAGFARVWDAARGTAITPPLKGDDFDARSVDSSAQKLRVCARFSPDETRVLSAWGSRAAHVWDATTGRQLLALPHDGIVHQAAFSRDGRHIVTSGGDNTARIWDAATGRPAAAPLVHERFVAWAEFSPDGRTLLTVSDRKTVHLWDWVKARELVPPMSHGHVLFHASFSPDGRHVLTAGWDMTARLWDTATGLGIARFHHPGGLEGAAFSPDGRWVATACYDGTARIWDVERSDQPLMSLPAGGPVEAVAFSPDGQRLAVASWNGTLHLWSPARDNSLVRTLPQLDVIRAEFSPDASRVLAASGWDGRSARAWDVATGTAIGPPLPHQAPIRSARLSRDGKRGLTGSDDGTARLWDLATGRELIPALRHPGPVHDALFSGDEQLIVTAGEEAQVRIWEASSGKLVRTLPHPQPVTALALSPTESRVATGCRDGTARIWDLTTGNPMSPPLTNPHVVLQVRFSPDGTRLVTACESPGRAGGTAQVWDTRTGRRVGAPLRHSDDIVTAEFNSNGRAVVTASSDRSARVWDAHTGSPVTPPLWHRNSLVDALFSPDTHRVATLTADGDVRLWDATTGEAVTASLSHPYRYSTGNLAFSESGQQLLIATSADAVYIREFTKNRAALEDLLLQAQVLSGHRIESTFGMTVLGTVELSNAWRTLHVRRPAPGAR